MGDKGEVRVARGRAQYLLELEQVHPVPGQEEEAAVLILLPGSGGILWARGAMHVGPVLPASRITNGAGLHGGDALAEACNQGSRSIREVWADPHDLRDSRPRLGTQGARADPAGDPFQDVATVQTVESHVPLPLDHQ